MNSEVLRGTSAQLQMQLESVAVVKAVVAAAAICSLVTHMSYSLNSCNYLCLRCLDYGSCESWFSQAIASLWMVAA